MKESIDVGAATDGIEIGIGLRHAHYRAILERPANIDFVEIHCENFYAEGGASHQLLREVSEKYALSFHGTSLGLGSFSEIPASALDKFVRLCDRYSPRLISDHACFSWGEIKLDGDGAQLVHGGDLLPIVFDHAQLLRFSENVDRVQNLLKRQILIENLSAYLSLGESTMRETEFLNSLCEKTGCGLILDVNNLVVNAHNNGESGAESVESYIREIRPDLVKEIHLAGCTPVADGELMVDDHSQPVPDRVWDAYTVAIQHLGARPSLVEWDNNLPEFDVLLAEADKARGIVQANLTEAK